MWTHEHSTDTPLAPEPIWRVLSDVDRWTDWDTSMDSVTLQGPLAVGTAVLMTPKGQEPIRSVITELRDNELHADETVFGGVTLRFSHALARLPDGGTRVTFRVEIDGEGADATGPELGPAITEDFPDAIRALIARAAATNPSAVDVS